MQVPINVEIEPLGDQAIRIEFPGNLTPELCRVIHALERKILDADVSGVIETVPAYNTIALYYQPWTVSLNSLKSRIGDLTKNIDLTAHSNSRHFEIKTCYSAQFGTDIDEVAAVHGMTRDEVISAHTGSVYTVAMIGFSPGFPYLLGLPQSLETPRRAQPRTTVAAGSVGIGGSQTGIYPSDSPGGWNIIGRTPTVLFDISQKNPSLLHPADTVQFVAIDEEQYEALCNSSR